MESSLVDEAVNRFKEGFSCSQAILITYGKQYGIDEKTARMIARSFGGGMARTCQTCGAVTGSYMVLGLENGQDNEKEAKDKTYALVQTFAQRFQQIHGNVNCQQLLGGCDLGTIEGQDYFRSNNLVYKCKGVVRDAAIILEDLISNKECLKEDLMEKCCSSEGCCPSKTSVAHNPHFITVDFLYLDLNDCEWCQGTEQNLQNAIAKLSDILILTGIKLRLNKIHVSTEQQADELSFTTSPTIRINGRDIQLNYKESQCTSCSDLCGDDVQCRVWLYQGKEYTSPPEGMIIEAILREVFGGSTNKISYNHSNVVPQNLKKFFHGVSKRKQR